MCDAIEYKLNKVLPNNFVCFTEVHVARQVCHYNISPAGQVVSPSNFEMIRTIWLRMAAISN